MTKPNINVTPLIDVLLVLLIIFMVITPTKPTDLKTKIPQEPAQSGNPNPLTLVVRINNDSTLSLNDTANLGTITEPEKLIEELKSVFHKRSENGALDETTMQIAKTVFIKAPRTFHYGKVVKVVDAVTTAGATPVSLQIDNLD